MSGGITTRDASLGLAALAASDCLHAAIEPVELLTGELVGAICAGCLREVPLAWWWRRECRRAEAAAKALGRLAPASLPGSAPEPGDNT